MKFDWPELMRFALGRLRLSPDQFWSMTVIELQAAIDGYYGVRSSVPLNRTRLEDLMFDFPDQDICRSGKNEEKTSSRTEE